MDWYNEMYELLISCCESHGNDELIKEYKSKHMGWKWISEDSQRKVYIAHCFKSSNRESSFFFRKIDNVLFYLMVMYIRVILVICFNVATYELKLPYI